MPKAKTIPAISPDSATDLIEFNKGAEAAKAVYAMEQTANAAATELANSLGYNGTLTAGALEDEIRFYQHQTVLSMLEMGRRLLLLKELTPHGEFERRIELLGFAVRTAQRFMMAAKKTAKSATVSLLAYQAKDCKVFLEIITQDDDVLDALAKEDEFDKMSPGQVREYARNMRADKEATERLLEQKNKQLDAHKRKPKLSPEEQAEHDLVPLFGLVAEGLNYLLRLQAEVFGLAESEVPILQIAARNAINLIAERIVHTSTEVQVPIDYDSTGPELKAFHDKVLGI